ncbi:leucine rich repeat family protein [Cryptosporidium serpentis]
MSLHIKIGSRVTPINDYCEEHMYRSYGCIGTVCYSNSINKTIDDTLVGVKWDEDAYIKTQYKNKEILITDGDLSSLENCQFFYLSELDIGISFEKAINERYGCNMSCMNTEEIENTKMDFFGFEKVVKYYENLKNIQCVSLEGMKISHCCLMGQSPTSKIVLTRVKTACLNNNLLYDWDTINCILMHMPFIECLTLNGNRFLKGKPNLKLEKIKTLKTLSMQNTNVELLYIVELCSESGIFGNLKQLNISSNRYQDLNIPLNKRMNLINQKQQNNKFEYLEICSNGIKTSIEVLDISSNDLISWKTLLQLLSSSFPNLKSLNISNNPLSDNLVDKDKIKSEISVNFVFDQIKEIFMDNCPINKWNTINEFRRIFPNLENLSIKGVPLLTIENLYDKNQIPIPKCNLRNIVIAMFSNLKVYNRSIINKEELISSRRYFIYLAIIKKHPIMEIVDPLREILGELQILEDTPSNLCTPEHVESLNEGSASNNFVKLTIIPEYSSVEKLPRKFDVNKSMKINDLKHLCWKWYRVPIKHSIYTYTNNRQRIDIIDYNDSCTLEDIGINSNGILRIQEKAIQNLQ